MSRKRIEKGFVLEACSDGKKFRKIRPIGRKLEGIRKTGTGRTAKQLANAFKFFMADPKQSNPVPTGII